MKLSKTLILLSFLIFGQMTIGQEIQIQKGASFKIKGSEYVEDVLSINNEGSSVLIRGGLIGKKFNVLNLDRELNIKNKLDIEIPEVNGKKVKYFWSLKFGENIYFLSRYFDKKTDEYYLFASVLDKKTGNLTKHYEACKVKDDKFSNFVNPFSAVRSIDSTKMLIITDYPTKNKENARYGLKVVNPDFSEVWSKDIEFPEMDKDFSLLDYMVDKNGNIHFVASIKMDREEKKEKGSKSRYYVNIYSYYHAENELKTYEIGGFEDKVIRSIDIDVNANDEIVGTGFYSERSLVNSYKGFLYLRINPESKEVVASNLTPFSKELLTELIGERRAEKGKEMPPYIIRHSIPLKTGGMAVVAEHFVYTQSQDANGNTTESWLYGNAVVMFIDKEGVMKTASVIKKKQYCTAKNGGATLLQQLGVGIYPGVNELPYYGIGVLENEGNIYVIYNENPKNAERIKMDKNPKSVRQRTSITQLVMFTPDGEVNSSVLFKSKEKDEKMPLMPRSSVQYSNNEMIVFGRKGKNIRMAKIIVK